MERLTNLETEKIAHKLWRLTDSLKFLTRYGLITVPKNFITDGASSPSIFYSLCTPMSGAHAEAAVLHDYLYSKDSDEHANYSRKTSDDLFYDAMIANGTGRSRASSIYWGVRLGGASSYKTGLSIKKITN